jgi:hypothetical protein
MFHSHSYNIMNKTRTGSHYAIIVLEVSDNLAEKWFLCFTGKIAKNHIGNVEYWSYYTPLNF